MAIEFNVGDRVTLVRLSDAQADILRANDTGVVLAVKKTNFGYKALKVKWDNPINKKGADCEENVWWVGDSNVKLTASGMNFTIGDTVKAVTISRFERDQVREGDIGEVIHIFPNSRKLLVQWSNPIHHSHAIILMENCEVYRKKIDLDMDSILEEIHFFNWWNNGVFKSTTEVIEIIRDAAELAVNLDRGKR